MNQGDIGSVGDWLRVHVIGSPGCNLESMGKNSCDWECGRKAGCESRWDWECGRLWVEVWLRAIMVIRVMRVIKNIRVRALSDIKIIKVISSIGINPVIRADL
jgi:hypothetical protein